MSNRATSSAGTSTSGSSVILKLPSSSGFSFDLSQSREDPLARRAAEHVFGETYVAECFSKLHRSSLSYDALISDLFEYERTHSRRPSDDPVYYMALESVHRDLVPKTKLVPYTIGAASKLASFPRMKSPGLPWKLDGYKNKGEVVDDPALLKRMNANWHHIGARIAHTPLPDTCLFARSQVCAVEKEKVRSVWGYPLEVYLEEARFFYPILEYLKGNEHSMPIGYGLEISKGGMAAISDAAIRLPSSIALMTDWSKFDKSIPPWLIRDAFAILADMIDFDRVLDSEGLYWPVRSYRSRRRWKKIIDYFIETPVRTCKGERFLVRAGVPSGSCFTNVIDSIVNCIITRYISYQTVGCFPRAEVYLGDDGVCIFPSSAVIDLGAMARLAKEIFGTVLSTDKSFVTSNLENIHFLGYHNRPVGMPNRDQSLLLVSFIHPERSRRTAEECAAAALGQLWANFDPGVAAMWYKVLVYVSDAYLVSFNDTLIQLRRTLHRHKYLHHIGRDAGKLTVPRLDEFGMILDVLPDPVPPRSVPIRHYDYGELYIAAFDRWSIPPD